VSLLRRKRISYVDEINAGHMTVLEVGEIVVTLTISPC
jgi:hypothetical protein